LDDSIEINTPDSIPKLLTTQNWFIGNDYYSLIEAANKIVLYRYSFDKKTWDSRCLSCLENFPILRSASYTLINDSLMSYSFWPKKELLIINLDKNKVVERIKIANDYAMPMGNSIQMYYDNDKIVFPTYYASKLDNAYSKNAKLILDYNRKTKETNYLGKFPASMNIQQNSRFNFIKPNIIFHKKSYIMNFKGDDFLYKSYYDSTNFEKILCKDNGVIKQDGIARSDNNVKEAILESFKGLYNHLLYDAKSQLYFRISITFPGFNGRMPKNIYEIAEKRKMLVHVLNSELNIIAKNYVEGVDDFSVFTRNGKLYLKKDSNKEENKTTYYAYKLIEIQGIDKN